MSAKHIRYTVALLTVVTLLGVLYADDLSTVHNCSKEAPVYNSDEILTREERIRRMDGAFSRSLTKFTKCDLSKPATSAGAASDGQSQTQSQSKEGAGGETSSESPASTSSPAGEEPQETSGENAGQSENTTASEESNHGLSGDEPQPQAAPAPVGSRGLSGDEPQPQAAPAPVGNRGLSGDEPQPQAAPAPVGSRGLSGDEPQPQAAPAPVGSRGLSGDEPPKPAKEAGQVAGTGGHSLDDLPPASTDDDEAARLRRAAKAEQDPQKQMQRWNEYRRYRGLPEWLPHGGDQPEPGNLPSADNDDALARQLRQAAETEQDPEKKARLWEEYRRYKGVSEKPTP